MFISAGDIDVKVIDHILCSANMQIIKMCMHIPHRWPFYAIQIFAILRVVIDDILTLVIHRYDRSHRLSRILAIHPCSVLLHRYSWLCSSIGSNSTWIRFFLTLCTPHEYYLNRTDCTYRHKSLLWLRESRTTTVGRHRKGKTFFFSIISYTSNEIKNNYVNWTAMNFSLVFIHFSWDTQYITLDHAHRCKYLFVNNRNNTFECEHTHYSFYRKSNVFIF